MHQAILPTISPGPRRYDGHHTQLPPPPDATHKCARLATAGTDIILPHSLDITISFNPFRSKCLQKNQGVGWCGDNMGLRPGDGCGALGRKGQDVNGYLDVHPSKRKGWCQTGNRLSFSESSNVVTGKTVPACLDVWNLPMPVPVLKLIHNA
ncbi:hypothetical protein VUR80DRAFT_6613 [Thermomyces stellatus]